MPEDKTTGLSEKQVAQIAAEAISAVKKSLNAEIDRNFTEKLPAVKTDLQTDMANEIGKQLKLPAEIIKNLQTIDADVKARGDKVNKDITDLTAKVDVYKERMKFVDLTKTVTMSYDELQSKLTKYSIIFGLVGALTGFLFGLVWMLWGR